MKTICSVLTLVVLIVCFFVLPGYLGEAYASVFPVSSASEDVLQSGEWKNGVFFPENTTPLPAEDVMEISPEETPIE